MSNSIISFVKLKKANLMIEARQKNFMFYELNSSVFEDVLVWIYKLVEKNEHIR